MRREVQIKHDLMTRKCKYTLTDTDGYLGKTEDFLDRQDKMEGIIIIIICEELSYGV